MKNKKLMSIILIFLIIGLFIVFLIINQNNNKNIKSEIVSNNEISEKVENIAEIKESKENENSSEDITNQNTIAEDNSFLAGNKEKEIITESKTDNISETNVTSKVEEKKQTNKTTTKTQEKKTESPKKQVKSNIEQSSVKQQEPVKATNQEEKTATEVIKESQKQDEDQIIETEIKETKSESKTPKREIPKCSDTQHGVGVGNSNKWFNSYNEAVAYYDNLINDYSDKVQNGTITFEEYNKLCPYGYETWSCPYCGKWTLNFYNR